MKSQTYPRYSIKKKIHSRNIKYFILNKNFFIIQNQPKNSYF